MKKISKFLSAFLALIMVVSIIPMSSITASAASTKTKEQAVAWINSRIGGNVRNMDGAAGYQCVDMVLEYYSFLGVSGGGGNACQYGTGVNNKLPSGFRRIPDEYGFVPQPGDIAVWDIGYGELAYCGHVGLVISADLYSITIAEVWGNSSGTDSLIRKNTYPYNGGSYQHFWGVIRPEYASSSVATTGITLNDSPFSLNIGESKTLSATVFPSNATNKTVTWSSSNTKVATVSSSGVVKAVGAGACTITAKASGGQTASVVAIVKGDTHSPVANATYNGHYYELYDDVLSWKDAKAYCESLGGHLVTITSQAENNFVQTLTSNGAQTNYYIGGTDEEKEGTWKWVTGEAFSYINLGDGEPSATEYEKEDYLFIGKADGKWRDIVNITGGVKVYGFVCEYDKIDGILFEELPEGADPDDYEIVKAYRSKDKQTTTSTSSTLDGWTMYDSQTTYGTWSKVQSTATKPTESDTLQITGTWKQYHYYHYCNYYSNQWNVDSIAYGSSSVRHDTYLNQKLPAISFQDQGNQQAYGGQGASGVTACDYNFYIWFYAGEKTFYNYQTRSKSTTNYFYKWSDWSKWTENPITATDTKQVETKNVYRLKDDTTTYTITYNANGGTGAPASQTKSHGTALTLSSTKPTRTGYTFLGWSTNKTATSATYSVGSSFTTNANTTLYAVWKANTYNVKFNANGGNGTMNNQSFTYDTAEALTANSFAREGYTFLGWSKSSTATTATYKDKQSVKNLTTTNGGYVTLYAVWQKNSVTPDIPENDFTFNIQEPSRTTIRNKDGIILHTNIEGNLPSGARVEWSWNNSKFDVEKNDDGTMTIIAENNGYTTFTATVYGADGNVLATDSIEMRSKSGFFDKIGGFFRSLFGSTNIYDK